MTGSAKEVYDLFEQQRRGNGRYASMADQLTAQQVAERDANFLMDCVACGEIPTWDEIRPELAKHLEQAGCRDASKFIHTTTIMAN
jgi:hypothetical protein